MTWHRQLHRDVLRTAFSYNGTSCSLSCIALRVPCIGGKRTNTEQAMEQTPYMTNDTRMRNSKKVACVLTLHLATVTGAKRNSPSTAAQL